MAKESAQKSRIEHAWLGVAQRISLEHCLHRRPVCQSHSVGPVFSESAIDVANGNEPSAFRPNGLNSAAYGLFRLVFGVSEPCFCAEH
jgi:hypothetical protein